MVVKYQKPSIAADIGMRMVATGYVVTVFAGMADVFGFGSHGLPDVPFFGPWQALGVQVGELLIGIGFLMMVPYSDPERRVGKTRDAVSETDTGLTLDLTGDVVMEFEEQSQ